MSEIHSTPYTALSDEELLAELQSTDEFITSESKQLDWVKENDWDSGLIDALEEGLDHACADYSWLQKELFYRGFSLNLETKIWEK